jgi:hypothetical protein
LRRAELKGSGSTQKHERQSIHYLENAFKSLEVGNSEKASEFLWGSMTQALKAVAASKEIRLKSHRQIWDYARELSKSLNDKDIFDTFLHANSLHSNFYESELTVEDVATIADGIKSTVAKLLELIPKSEDG